MLVNGTRRDMRHCKQRLGLRLHYMLRMTHFFPTTLSSGAEGIRDAPAKKESKKLDPVRSGRGLQMNLDAGDSAVNTG